MFDLRAQLFRIWFRLARPMTLGVRAIVENEAGQVLLVRHTYTKGLFLPGGGVERGEPALEALRRELEEEGGVKLTGMPELIGIYSNHQTFRNDHVLLYKVTAPGWQTCPATSRGEISETVWINPKAPPEDITPGNRRRLQEAYAHQARQAYW